MAVEKYHYFIDADNVAPSPLPFETFPPREKLYIVGNDSGKKVNAWKESLKAYDHLIIEYKVVSSRHNEADYHLIHRIYETAEQEHQAGRKFCMVLASADHQILEASRYVADVLVQFARSNQANTNKIADFVVFSNHREMAIVENLVRKICSSIEMTPSGDFLMPLPHTIEFLRDVGVIQKEQKRPLRWIVKQYSSIFSWDKENQTLTIKKSADVKTVSKLFKHFEEQ